MKKMFVNFKSLGFVALAAAALTFTSCTKEATIKCAESRDDNFESTTLDCNPTTTVAKFVGTWEFTLGNTSYTATAALASEDYKVLFTSSYGVEETSASKDFIAPITKSFDVNKNVATFASIDVTGTNAYINDIIFKVDGNTATLTYTIKVGTDEDTYTDNGVKL